jgi:hypothetical protein
MGISESGEEGADLTSAGGYPLPELVDWIAAALITLGGLILTVGGSALSFVVDRTLLEEGIESGEITVIVFERDLTQAEMLAFTRETIFWIGIGLLVTGIGLVLFAILYVAVRHRTHRQAAADESASSYWVYAVLGAVTTTVLSFLPFSPALGGGVAGYLEQYGDERPVSVGALSGLLAVVPAIMILVFVAGGLFAGFATIRETGLGIVVAVAMLLVVLFTAAYGAGIGALGGFAGGRLAERES